MIHVNPFLPHSRPLMPIPDLLSRLRSEDEAREFFGGVVGWPEPVVAATVAAMRSVADLIEAAIVANPDEGAHFARELVEGMVLVLPDTLPTPPRADAAYMS